MPEENGQEDTETEDEGLETENPMDVSPPYIYNSAALDALRTPLLTVQIAEASVTQPHACWKSNLGFVHRCFSSASSYMMCNRRPVSDGPEGQGGGSVAALKVDQ